MVLQKISRGLLFEDLLHLIHFEICVHECKSHGVINRVLNICGKSFHFALTNKFFEHLFTRECCYVRVHYYCGSQSLYCFGIFIHVIQNNFSSVSPSNFICFTPKTLHAIRSNCIVNFYPSCTKTTKKIKARNFVYFCTCTIISQLLARSRISSFRGYNQQKYQY